jgi:hypothetical protein
MELASFAPVGPADCTYALFIRRPARQHGHDADQAAYGVPGG